MFVWSKLSTNRWLMPLLSFFSLICLWQILQDHCYPWIRAKILKQNLSCVLDRNFNACHLHMGDILTKTKKLLSDNDKIHCFPPIMSLSINTRNRHFTFFLTEYGSLNNNYIFQLFSLSNLPNCRLFNCPDSSR